MGRAGGSWSVQAMGRKSANPYGIRVGALTSVEVRGGMWYQLSPICAADGPPFLSRKELRSACFPFTSFRILAFLKENIPLPLEIFG